MWVPEDVFLNLSKGDSFSFPQPVQLEELVSPQMCRPKPRISNEEKQVVDVLYISGRFAP